MGSATWWGEPPEDPYSPCPCGSGKKYKFCCRDKERAQPVTPVAAWPRDDEEEPPSLAAVANATAAEKSAQYRRLDQAGQRLMEHGDYAAATKKFRAAIAFLPAAPFSYNNLALCEYLQGNLGGAIAQAEQTLREIEPDNIYAHGLLVHLRLIRGPRTEAERLGKRLLAMQPQDESAAIKRVEAFARLDWHAEVLTACAQAPERNDPDFDYFAGVAAANLGRNDEAMQYLQQARGKASCRASVRRFIALLGRKRGPNTLRGHWPYFPAPDVVCEPVMRHLAHKLDKKQEKAENLPGLVFFAVAMLDEELWESGIIMLQRIGSDEAVTLLREIAEGVCGPDEARMQALQALQELERAPVKMRIWLKGEWREIGAQTHEITGVPTRPVPPALASPIARAHQAMQQRRWTEAERLWRGILAKDPAYLATYNNLAGCLVEQGRKDEAIAVLEEVLRRDPQYNFALMTLASLQLKRDPDAAKALMRRVNLPQKVHISEMLSWLLLQARVALHDGEYESAEGSWQQAKELMPEHPGVLALKEMFAQHAPAAEMTARLLRHLRGRAERQREQARRRILDEKCMLAHAYGGYRKEELVELAKRLGLPKPYQLGKAQLLQQVCELMATAGAVERLLTRLEGPAREALRALVAADNGAMEFTSFTRTYEHEAKDIVICDVLRRDGLAVTGMWRGRSVVMVPPAVRALLKEMPV